MDVRVTETYGQLRAADAAGKPLAKVYVKVYSRLADGQVKFHKDGYTDHRGRFDYASVSTPEKQPISRFSILALSTDRGVQVRWPQVSWSGGGGASGSSTAWPRASRTGAPARAEGRARPDLPEE